MADPADKAEQPPSFNPYPPDRPRRSWTGCLPPLLWLVGTVGSTVVGCLLGAAHYNQLNNGPPNPGLYSEMRVYHEAITNGGLIGAGAGAFGGALLWLIFSFVSKDPRSR